MNKLLQDRLIMRAMQSPKNSQIYLNLETAINDDDEIIYD